jgi:hypothetical protein
LKEQNKFGLKRWYAHPTGIVKTFIKDKKSDLIDQILVGADSEKESNKVIFSED